MPVNLAAPNPAEIYPIAGIRLGFAKAQIKKWDRNDVMLLQLDAGSTVAGVFTQNAFAAAPVQICRKHLDARSTEYAPTRALIINAGNANCGTGQAGYDAAAATCEAVAAALNISPAAVLPFSTGVILEPLPAHKIIAALPYAIEVCEGQTASEQGGASGETWVEAAKAIMTTDTIHKCVSRRVTVAGQKITVTGIAKGVGMLQPNMATMLAYIATDAAVPQPVLQTLCKTVADASFNRVTVDGDTSTNDSFILMATGKNAGESSRNSNNTSVDCSDSAGAAYTALQAALLDVAQTLAQAIARDGEGATKFITVNVDGAEHADEAHTVAKFIAHSPLVKTAFFASDPNLGRLIMAIGNAQPNLNPALVNVWLGDVLVVESGGRAASYTEALGAAVMALAEITVRVALGRGVAKTTVWTCDYSYDYVKINAEYRT